MSLLICTRDRWDGLRQALESVGDEPDLQIIVVDNGSSARPEWIVDAPVVLVEEPRAGLGRARNAGLRRCTGELILMVDDDCRLLPDTLAKVHAFFAVHPEIGWAGGRLLRARAQDSDYNLHERQTPIWYPAPASHVVAGDIQGACLALRRSALDRAGFWDGRLGPGTRWRFEEIEWCQRAIERGVAGAFEPSIAIIHAHGRIDGPEIEEIRKQNDVARGAYYARFIRHRWHRKQLVASLVRPHRTYYRRQAIGALQYGAAWLMRRV